MFFKHTWYITIAGRYIIPIVCTGGFDTWAGERDLSSEGKYTPRTTTGVWNMSRRKRHELDVVRRRGKIYSSHKFSAVFDVGFMFLYEKNYGDTSSAVRSRTSSKTICLYFASCCVWCFVWIWDTPILLLFKVRLWALVHPSVWVYTWNVRTNTHLATFTDIGVLMTHKYVPGMTYGGPMKSSHIFWHSESGQNPICSFRWIFTHFRHSESGQNPNCSEWLAQRQV